MSQPWARWECVNSQKSRDLPTPGSPATRHELSLALAGLFQCVAELVHLDLAPHERREAARRLGLQARAERREADDLEDFHGRGQSLDGHRPERLHLDVALGEAQRLAGDQGRAGPGELLHARGQVRRLADGGVVHVQVAVDGAHDHLARVEADADLHVDALAPAQFLGVPAHRLLHADGGAAGAHRVILVGDRRAEERHDAVAHHLVHRALVAVDGLHHPLEDGVEELARLLGVAVGEQLHGALEVGEEDGDLLALALERRPCS